MDEIVCRAVQITEIINPQKILYPNLNPGDATGLQLLCRLSLNDMPNFQSIIVFSGGMFSHHLFECSYLSLLIQYTRARVVCVCVRRAAYCARRRMDK